MVPFYGICRTAAGTQDKVVIADDIFPHQQFSLHAGAKVCVLFTAANSHAMARLNVLGTGAYPIFWRNAQVGANSLAANDVHELIFDGIRWRIIGALAGNLFKAPLQFSAGWTGSNSYVSVNSFNQLVIFINATKNATITGSEVFAVLPSGYRPSVEHNIPAMVALDAAYNTTGFTWGVIRTNGSLVSIAVAANARNIIGNVIINQ